MSRLAFAAVIVVALSALAACDQYGEMTSPVGQARMRLINVSPDAPALSLALNDSVIQRDVAFPGASDYSVIPATRAAPLIVTDAGGAAIGALTLAPVLGADYATVVFGSGTNRFVASLRSESEPAPAGMVRVRVVHTAEPLGVVDVYITPPETDIDPVEPTFSERGFTVVSAYTERLAGTFRLRTTPAGEKDVLLDAENLQLMGGRNYSLFLIESQGGGEPYGVFVVEDFGG